MIYDWFTGKPAEAEKPEAAAAGSALDEKKAGHLRQLREAEVPLHRELSAEEADAARDRAVRKKLRDGAKEAARGVGPNNAVTYDSMFRDLQRVMMGGEGDNQDGITVGVSRSVHNLQVSSKWSVGNPQQANWELSLQMAGFSNITAVTYSTLGRLMLLHQRVFKSGALGMMQFMAQPEAMAQGQPPTLFAMLQVPWLRGGATQISYLRPQHVSVSHAARVLRGVTVGASATHDLSSGGTTVQYGFHTVSKPTATQWCGQWAPEAGTWKLAMIKGDWANDSEMGVQLEVAEKKAAGGNPMAAMMGGGGGGGPAELASSLTLAVKKNFIGGAAVSAALTNFGKLKAELELPFGGSRPGMNQAALNYSVQYDAAAGAAKHGVSLSL